MADGESVSIDTSRPQVHEIFEQAAESGRDELRRSSRALAISGLAGGFTMGLTGMSVAIVRALLPAGPTTDFISYALYPLGFIAVIIGRQQLFTENTLYPVVLVLTERRHVGNTLRLWGVVFTANVAGAFLFAALAVLTPSLEPKVMEELVKLGTDMVAASTSNVFWSGVIGGWMIALVAWIVTASQWTIGQVAMIWLLTFVVGAGHFSHCIATSNEIIAASLAGPVPMSSFFHWLLFATMGNILGGVTIVSLMNWGQVHAGKDESKPQPKKSRRAA
ncbi:MAG: formate/nitrite transporter family protein [Terriglobales bacterium]